MEGHTSNEDVLSEAYKQKKVLENVSNWQLGENPLTEITEEQLDILYQVKDLIEENYYGMSKTEDQKSVRTLEQNKLDIPTINTHKDYVQWMVNVEKEVNLENLNDYFVFHDKLEKQSLECEKLFKHVEDTSKSVEFLHEQYQDVTAKTDSLHSLSEQLMKQQKILKDKKAGLTKHLHYFKLYRTLLSNVNHYSSNVSSEEFMETLNQIDDCMSYIQLHPNFKESKSYTAKYENILAKAVIFIKRYFNDVVASATKQVTDPDKATNLLAPGNDESQQVESAFSLYYGKFQSAAAKVKPIINHIEAKVDKHTMYQQLLFDCQQTYFSLRSPIMTDAVTKALLDLKNKHKSDHSILFRSAGLFVMQICQDESTCFNYFFSSNCPQLDEYFGILSQQLYDMLRPCLISIYHLEVLTELCGILRGEMLNDQIQNNEILRKFKEVILQLLEDIEERLVFRTNIFFHNDLKLYQPSPGDLAYPDKLEQMENITEELESRAESRGSLESQEVANINARQVGQFRSYTGNSPADLHGMWYPTVKRTLVCLSRLYCCLDREIFQGLAQEALCICVETIAKAESLISARKTSLDGRLFQIKHLLILREQIAPFQVDFTVKEVGLDFSNIKTAAMGLIQNRNNLFTFSSHNAVLEFLLEGTPKVKEYLIDSRKEIDKQLKASCEAFIANTTNLLIGDVLKWIQQANSYLQNANSPSPLHSEEFGKAQILSRIISEARKNIKLKIPEVQRGMQLYLANKETEFILFRPIKINIMNAFMQIETILETAKYSHEDQLIVACPTPEQANVLICSVSLASEQDSQDLSRSASVVPKVAKDVSAQ
ncbi:hypothetical protein PPYR_05891 [Photinus pyralis]|uniref:Conserved oligomeric Golgi complex subunit 3 n=1 Tax=Photinus pyralis TaxID=7054 RepID=A0A5N4AW39_PHOPY|nr:conserved oligomeric Golgi complex subunit 3 [Photinus pyralis]KAB0801537.1 hypothetical protein PPYR_05891 [Photinus pyralis]